MCAYLLGIDIGTSNIKAVLITPDGDIIGEAQTHYETSFPQAGWAEQNPDDWWQGTVTVVRQVIQKSGKNPREIAGIGVSGQGCAVTLIDKAGAVIRPAIIWMDSRSEPQCEVMRQCCADDLLRINGKSPAPYNADPVLMWLKAHESESLSRARYSLTSTSYINYRLTGEVVMNTSDASILFAFDLARGDWSDDLIERFGLPRHLYPPVVPCETIIGTLQASVADELGLPADIPVIAGGEDTSSAGLAIGVARPGEALLSLGTAGTIYVVQDAPNVCADLLAFAHVLSGQVLLGGSLVAVGGALNWFQKTTSPGLSHADFVALAAESEAGAGGLLFLPYLSGELQPINDGNARGVFFGLSMSTTRAQMIRAVLEGTAFAIAHNIQIASQYGTPITEIRAVGGPSRSALWCQIIADITGYPVSALSENAGAPLGDALLAGAGVGLIDDLARTAKASSGRPRIYEPDQTYRARYDTMLEIYTGLYPKLASSFARLHTIP